MLVLGCHIALDMEGVHRLLPYMGIDKLDLFLCNLKIPVLIIIIIIIIIIMCLTFTFI